MQASGAKNATLRYDPLGRLYQLTGTATRRFLYDGDALVAEYTGSGVLAERYVHGTAEGVDDPLIWYDGSVKRWLHADHQGSIVAVTDGAGAMHAINAYDEYGVPKSVNGAPANVGRFQYTGQAWIPELGMYHYKARVYDPKLGRFLQVDPVGYDDQINLYAYVGNDPVNNVDHIGQECSKSGSTITCTITLDKRFSEMTKSERQYAVGVIRNYTIAAARADHMASRGASVIVPEGDGKPSFRVPAAQVRNNLFKKEVKLNSYYTSSRAASVSFGGPINVYRNVDQMNDADQQRVFLHEEYIGRVLKYTPVSGLVRQLAVESMMPDTMRRHASLAHTLRNSVAHA